MSWNFTLFSREKEKVKKTCRERILHYHPVDTKGHAQMVRMADQLDSLLDQFHVQDGTVMKLQTDGHIYESGHGYCKIEITTEAGNFLD